MFKPAAVTACERNSIAAILGKRINSKGEDYE